MPTIATAPAERVDASLALFPVKDAEGIERFRAHNAEQLLNSAADLLDRCLAERRYAAELSAAWAREGLAEDLEDISHARLQHRYETKWFDLAVHASNVQVSELESQRALYEEAERNFNNYYYTLSGSAQKAFAPNVSLNSIATKRWNSEKAIAAVAQAKEVHPASERDQATNELTAREKRKTNRLGLSINGAPLDYEEQVKIVTARFTRDYDEATQRISAASKGLDSIYGYSKVEESFQATLARVRNREVGAIDNAVSWVRTAIRWMSGFAALDQSFTVTLSLREFLSADEWMALKSGAITRFSIPRSHFSRHAYVRMRGVSASLVAPASPTAIARLLLAVPRSAYYEHIDKTTGQIVESDVSQNALPYCEIGRVLDISSPLPPEINGAVSLFNASPLGRSTEDGFFVVKLEQVICGSRQDIEDLIIDIRVTGRPKSGTLQTLHLHPTTGAT